MLHISTALKHYKRAEVQNHILSFSKNKEIATRYGDNGFGKRPELVYYPNDILSLVQQGATSFHVSEEYWNNVQELSNKLTKQQLTDLRAGWDLILDIDCPVWEYAKLITHYLVQEIRSSGVKNISVKFSGSKGFHIGVPFSSFPSEVHGRPTKLLFPEGIRRIALYLRDKVEARLLNHLKMKNKFSELIKTLDIPEDQLYYTICSKCHKKQKEVKSKIEFICPSCQQRIFGDENSDEKYVLCSKCRILMEKFQPVQKKCIYCDSHNFEEKYDLSKLIGLDTVLISSRHLYRMPYSLHEKSGLVSIPIRAEDVLNFNKDSAHPDKINFSMKFMDPDIIFSSEASNLILEAFDYKPEIQQDEMQAINEFSIPEDAVPVELFPPCIKLGLQGMKDGKKRFLFVLINFLKSSGWSHEKIVELVKDWNSKSDEPLRDTIIESQLRASKDKKPLPPPNCDNDAYMLGIGICKPDNLCRMIKNPVQYPSRMSGESKGRKQKNRIKTKKN